MMSPSGEARSADPRARAAQTKRDRTRRALLDAADATFGSRGWARTRMEDVAAAAGVSPATAYNHFSSKHALLGHVYGPLVSPLVTQAERDITAGRPMVDALVDQVKALSRTTFRNQTLTAAFWAAIHEYSARAAGAAEAGNDVDPRVLAPIPASLRMLIEHGQASGELRTFPPAREFSAIIVNLLLQECVNRPHEPPENTSELLLTVMFGALRPDLVAARDRPFRGGR